MKKILFYLLGMLALGCRERYDLPLNVPKTGYLVVEGVINTGAGGTTITLTRTSKLIDSFVIRQERKAVVRIEGKNNTSFALTEASAGQYVSGPLNLVNMQEYRLYIRTSGGQEYVSDYRPVIASAAKTSVSWERNNNGVQIFGDNRDLQNSSRYYHFDFEETWEFHSSYYPYLKYVLDPITNEPKVVFLDTINYRPDTTMFKCWRTENSNRIEIASTVRLSQDSTHHLLVTIPPASWKIGVLYSINVRQYVLSQQGYEYLSKMKKNTEQKGSIFDAQPSELKGNIHNVKDPQEPVIGFIDISNVRTQRIFISRSDIPNWGYSSGCREKVVSNTPAAIQEEGYPVPTSAGDVFRGRVITFNGASDPTCVDCTLRGVNKKPAFWP